MIVRWIDGSSILDGVSVSYSVYWADGAPVFVYDGCRSSKFYVEIGIEL